MNRDEFGAFRHPPPAVEHDSVLRSAHHHLQGSVRIDISRVKFVFLNRPGCFTDMPDRIIHFAGGECK